jgi:hypothetical protein
LVGGTSSGSIQLYGSGHSTPNILQYASPDTHKWQCNGVERASLSSAGNLTVGGTLTVSGSGDSTLTGPLSWGTTVPVNALLLYKTGTTKYGNGLTSGSWNNFVPAGSNKHSWGYMSTSDGTTYTELATLTANTGVLAVLGTTASTSTSSGALVVSGGVGVAKSLNVGEAVTVAGGSFAAASFYKSASLGTVLSGATGSSYDLYITNPAGNYVMQVPTGTRNAEFAATLTTVGAITSGASISTSAPTGGSGAWELGVYSATAPSATGYVTIEIGGTVYKLLASNV